MTEPIVGKIPAPLLPLAVPISELEEWDRNPNRGDDEAVAASLDRFSALQIAVYRVEGGRKVIVAGNTRYRAARRLGWTHYPAIDAAHLSYEQARAYGLADNKTRDRADLDRDALADVVSEITDDPYDDLLTAAGYDPGEILNLIHAAEQHPTDGTDTDVVDPGPAAPPTDPISRVGDTWYLGRHTLHVADFRDTPAVEADTAVIDPPWDQPELWADATARHSGAGAWVVFTGPKRLADTLTHVGIGGLFWSFTWNTLNTFNLNDSEPVQRSKLALVYLHHGREYRRDAELWGDPPPARDHPTTKQTPLDGRRLTDVWDESLRWLHNPDAGTRGNTERTSLYESGGGAAHAKPADWVRCLIGNVTPDGGTVADPFTGGGTTFIAAEPTGLTVVGAEIDPAVADVALTRWHRATGVCPVRGGIEVPFR